MESGYGPSVLLSGASPFFSLKLSVKFCGMGGLKKVKHEEDMRIVFRYLKVSVLEEIQRLIQR